MGSSAARSLAGLLAAFMEANSMMAKRMPLWRIVKNQEKRRNRRNRRSHRAPVDLVGALLFMLFFVAVHSCVTFV